MARSSAGDADADAQTFFRSSRGLMLESHHNQIQKDEAIMPEIVAPDAPYYGKK